MAQIGAFEAKNTFGTLLDRVEQGEEIVITRHGKAVARLAPLANTGDGEDARTAIARLHARARTLVGGPPSWAELKADRDTGRP